MMAARLFLAAIGLGLVLIGQPWSHALFVLGFPLALVGLIAFNVAARLGQGPEEGP